MFRTGRVIMAICEVSRGSAIPLASLQNTRQDCVHMVHALLEYDVSYNPVVSWTTIQLLLTLTLVVMGWSTTRQILLFPRQIPKRTYLWRFHHGGSRSHYKVQDEELVRKNTRAPNPNDQPNVVKLLKNLII